MSKRVEIENIEEMRRLQGIDDVKLREEIRALQAGHMVRLTFLTAPAPGAAQTLLVRITSIKGRAFHGKLAEKPASTRQSKLRPGLLVAFTADHIHSVPKEQPIHGQ
jgi:hypothetical protein